MLKIKLQRIGRKHDPSYRVVVTDRRTGPKSNKHVSIVGNYDNIRKVTNLKKEEILDWISKGAQPTETVHNILVKEGVIKGDKKNVLPKKTPIINKEKKEKKKEETKTNKPTEVEEKDNEIKEGKKEES